MFPYIVVVDHKYRKGEWAIRDREIHPRDWICSYPEMLHKPDQEGFTVDRPVGMQVTYCHNEVDANLQAQYMAKLHPNSEVYVTKVLSIAISRVSAPSVLNVTDKGVLPR